MKIAANIWEHKVGINAIIANFVCTWKSRIEMFSMSDPARSGR